MYICCVFAVIVPKPACPEAGQDLDLMKKLCWETLAGKEGFLCAILQL